jgi:hypothetical protein
MQKDMKIEVGKKPRWNERVTDFYARNRGMIWIVAILLVLFYLFGNSGSLPVPYAADYDVGYAQGGGMMAVRNAVAGVASAPAKMMYAESDGVAYDEMMMYPRPYPAEEPGYVEGEEAKVRKTAWMQLEVEKEDYEEAKDSIEAIITSSKGFYVSKNEYKNYYDDSSYKTYTTSIKVPVESFESAMLQLKKVAEIKNMNIDASDLTSQYHDTKAELESKKALKARVEELLKKADRIEDIIRLEEKISEYQQQIDYIEKRLTNIERQTDYSTITVTLEEKHEIKESFYEFTGLRQLVRNMVRSFDRIIVTFSNLIGWIVLGLLVWGGYRLYKRKK